MPVVHINELDELLRHFDEGYKQSHDEAYKRFDAYSATPPDDLPDDPFSDAYAERYLEIYRKISGRALYTPDNERCDFDVDQLTLRPFPYFTRSLKLAAQHYSLIGKLMEVMDIREGSDILEFGFGWGNTTLAFAMLGHRVTAVDIEPQFCELVRRRAAMLRVDIDIVNADFMWIETTDKKFDAICFFECFHHCWEFKRLLDAMHRVLRPGGKIYFGAEPINSDFTVPWGVRLDGQSLFVARRNGWMELGFHSDFFAELLSRTGWIGQCVHPHFWVATSKSDPIVYPASDPRLASLIGLRQDDMLHIEAPGAASDYHYGLFGPYVGLPKGNYLAEIRVMPKHAFDGEVVVDVVHDAGKTVAGIRTVGFADMVAGRVAIAFAIERGASDIEVRMKVPGGFSAAVQQVSFSTQ